MSTPAVRVDSYKGASVDRGNMARILQRGWRVYDRGGVWWISYPLDGDTKRESTRERDRARADAYMERRRSEVESTSGPKASGPSSDIEEGVAPCTGAVRLPAEMVDVALSLLERANAYDVNTAVRLGIKLASAIRRHQVEVGALPDWRRQ